MNRLKLAATLSLVLFLGGCSYSVEVNEKAYVIAVGIDEGEDEMLRVSFLFAYPDSGTADEGGGEKEKEKDLVTVEAPTVYSALRLLDTFKSKRVDVSHTKLIVFSETLAEKGINDLIVDFVNTRGFRPSVYVCVAQSGAEKLFEGMEPKQDSYIEKYIEHLFSRLAENETGGAYLYNFYFNCVRNEAGGVMPLVGLTREGGAEDEAENYPYEKIDDLAINYTADEIPRDGKSVASLCGYAVFDGKKMAGTLGMLEGDVLDMINKNLSTDRLAVLDPKKEKYVGITLRQADTPRISVRAGAIPEIDVSVRLWGEFTGIGYVLETREEYEDFVRYLSESFSEKASRLAERTQNELGSDIFGFGNYAKRGFLTNEQWNNYNWKEKYKSAKINIDISVDVNDFGEMKASPR